jgi:hypothetical protein
MATAASSSRVVRIAPTEDHLVVDGRPWFLLADTIWSAFTHVPEPDWTAYLRRRSAQGFNSLLISALPILHDMSETTTDLQSPFTDFWKGAPKFGALRPGYAEIIRARVGEAVEFGFTPVIVDIWCNYAPETWASRSQPGYVIPADAVRAYLESLVEALAPHEAIHLVSGDADFKSEASIAFYAEALRCLKQLSPTSLAGMHLQPEANLPAELADADDLDLYVYQSGHHAELQHLPYTLAEAYRSRPRLRPVLNVEPPYDGHGHGFRYGRFDARDVRRASWQSVLAGASAGLGYGAHGVWQWHERGACFNHAEFSGAPFDHDTALGLSGAADVAFLKYLVESLGLMEMRPAQELIRGGPSEVRVATSADGGLTVVYAPSPIEITLATEDAGRVERWNLETRTLEMVAPAYRSELTIPMPEWLADSLTVVYRGEAT